MLHNDIVGHGITNTNKVVTRDLQNTVFQHHKNNPPVSMESAFAYVMSNSSIFRALPPACIAKARSYLLLPKTVEDARSASTLIESLEIPLPLYHITCTVNDPQDEPIGITEHDLDYREIPRLPTNELNEFVQLVVAAIPCSDTMESAFGRVRRETPRFTKMHSIDIHNAWTLIPESVANRHKPNTTVVHAEYPGSVSNAISKNNITKVHAERVVVNNKKMIKILKFENVRLLSNLPNKYTASQPIYCWFRSGIELKYHDAPHTIHQNVLPGDILSLKEFGQMIKTMKEAGVRLSKINKTVKLEKEHSGKFTVSV